MSTTHTGHRFGWVALMGPPNAGKSTLLNALLGQKVSIVTSKPQTTRNRIVGILSEPDAQVVFMDTPGLHHARNPMRGHLGKMMSQAAWESMAAAQAVMLVLDADLYLRKPEFLERDVSPLRGPNWWWSTRWTCSTTSPVCCLCWSGFRNFSPKPRFSPCRPSTRTAWRSLKSSSSA